MKNPIDLVYVLGSGSKWNDNELRFSLRSVEKNLKGKGKVYVVGENPVFLSNEVIHIPHPDPLGGLNADGNMAMKILRACEEESLSDDFLFMNDDFIINRPMQAAKVPWLHKEDMAMRPEKYWHREFYRKRLRRTFEVLRDRNLPTIQYDYHAPMLMNKHEFPKVMEQFDYKADIGYTFRSLYGNCLALTAVPILGKKITLYRFQKLEKIREETKNIPFVGYNDFGLNNSLKWWMIDSFPEISRYEKTPIDDRLMDVYFWLQNGREWDEGVRLFQYFYKQINVTRLMMQGKSEILSKKLDFKINQLIKEL